MRRGDDRVDCGGEAELEDDDGNQKTLRMAEKESILMYSDKLPDDVNFGITGTTNVNTSDATLSKKQVKNLIEHDHKILQHHTKNSPSTQPPLHNRFTEFLELSF